jgi:hypothetical protein
MLREAGSQLDVDRALHFQEVARRIFPPALN